jgi:flotillin
MNLYFIGGIALASIILLTLITAALFRTVVATNYVHIVQSAKTTISYGKDQVAGNTYYSWPSWFPVIGVKSIILPVSVFDQTLDGYASYDKGRVPFVIDVMAFFRIFDSNTAAQRVSSFNELLDQLKSILQGAIRTILATSEIEEILEGRGKFGEMFTKEVDEQLKSWGVQNVKCIELMDIRDASGSNVIANIMAKKQSLIEKQSRTEVAQNRKDAEIAEIQAKREVQIRAQEAEQAVGIRTAEKEKEVGVSKQKAVQTIKEEEKITTQKAMEVVSVEQVRKAEIDKEVQIVGANRDREVQVISAEKDKKVNIVKAEGTKQQTVLVAEGNLSSKKLEAEGILAEGTSKAESSKLMQLAPVQAQITLAKEIGENEGYQKYLISIKQIDAAQAVGVKQAEALTNADIKVITNSGSPSEGLSNVMDLFSSKGGTQLSAMLEAIRNSDTGKAILDKVTSTPSTKK